MILKPEQFNHNSLPIGEADKNIFQRFAFVFIAEALQAVVSYNITFINDDDLVANGLYLLHNMG